MLTTANHRSTFFHKLNPVSLDALNKKAPMLTRLDNKYIIHAPALQKAVDLFRAHFDILEINHLRLFTYDTCYFDDEDLTSYHSHHQGRRQRIKIRTRKYLEADSCFVETKIKSTRGATIKTRLPYDTEKHGELDENALLHVEKIHQAQYNREFGLPLTPKLNLRYQRATLVAKNAGERITIDCNLRFFSQDTTINTASDIFIIETKSKNGNGIADTILRQLHQRPTNKCSKYCLGMCITQQVTKMNNFLPALRKLGKLSTLKTHNEHE
jgi:hypothetical protein